MVGEIKMDSNPNHPFKLLIISVIFLPFVAIHVQSTMLSPSPLPSLSPSSSPLQSPSSSPSPSSSYINPAPGANIESPNDDTISTESPTDGTLTTDSMDSFEMESPTDEPPSTESLTDEPSSIESTETDESPFTKIPRQDPSSITKPHSILFPSLPNGTKVNPIIEKICEKTDYPALCISSISPLFNGRGDPISVLELTIKACADYTKLAMGVAKRLIVLPSTSQQIASVLGDCTDFFDDALDNLDNARKAIATRDIGTINSMLSAAISDYVTCEDEFEGEISPLADYDDKLSNMASNCLAIASLI